jgi:hypothetical protein
MRLEIGSAQLRTRKAAVPTSHIQKSLMGLAGHEHLEKRQIPQSFVKFSKRGLEMYLSV